MDPIANLKEQLELAREITAICDGCKDLGALYRSEQNTVMEHAARLAELVEALDEWQRKGGFSPYSGRTVTT